MAGQGIYKRCTYKGCRTKSCGTPTSKNEDFCNYHLTVWAIGQIESMNDFSLALQTYIEMRIDEAVRQATNKATSPPGEAA